MNWFWPLLSKLGSRTLVTLFAVLFAVDLIVPDPLPFVDAAMMALGMKRFGTSRRAMIGAAVGMALGVFFGLPGLIVGPFAGAVLGELTAHQDLRRAGRAGVAAWIGFVIGTAVKVGLAFAMVGLFMTAWFVF